MFSGQVKIFLLIFFFWFIKTVAVVLNIYVETYDKRKPYNYIPIFMYILIYIYGICILYPPYHVHKFRQNIYQIHVSLSERQPSFVPILKWNHLSVNNLLWYPTTTTTNYYSLYTYSSSSCSSMVPPRQNRWQLISKRVFRTIFTCF